MSSKQPKAEKILAKHPKVVIIKLFNLGGKNAKPNLTT